MFLGRVVISLFGKPGVSLRGIPGYADGISSGCDIAAPWTLCETPEMPEWRCGFSSQDADGELVMSSKKCTESPSAVGIAVVSRPLGEEDGIEAGTGDDGRCVSFVPTALVSLVFGQPTVKRWYNRGCGSADGGGIVRVAISLTMNIASGSAARGAKVPVRRADRGRGGRTIRIFTL